MKIIHQGKSPDPIMRGTCKNCKTVIECKKSETTYLSDRGEPGVDGIECSVCKHWIYPKEYKEKYRPTSGRDTQL